MNGSQGVIPTFDVSGNGNNNGWGGSMGEWIIGLVALGMLGNGGLFGGFGGNNGMMYEFPWLLTGQQGINNNTNNGFDTLHLSNQIEGVRDGVYGISNQLCNSTADVVQAVNSGFSSAEIAENARQIANMNQAFNSQISTLQGFNTLGSQLAQCCCDNRLATANLNSTILSENCADRAALADGLKDVLINQTANTQRILDQLCNDKIDAKNEKILDLQRQLDMADLRASQAAQNAFISQGFANEVDALYNRLANCPVPSTPVYGRTPIFTCNNNGCGCGYNTTSQFI